jgi:hypothetical protein
MKKYFLPRTDAGLRTWLNNLNEKIPAYATKYAVTTEERADIAAAATDFAAMLDYADAIATYGQSITARKNELRDGIPAGGTPSVATAPPTPPTLTCVPGFIVRISSICNRIKGHTAYTTADGEALGLEGASTTVDLNTVKPRISGTTALADKVVIDWVKGGMQGVTVESSLDGANWAKRDKDFRSPWEDTAPNRGTDPEWRHYRLRYLFQDQSVGLYSDVVKVLVSIHA